MYLCIFSEANNFPTYFGSEVHICILFGLVFQVRGELYGSSAQCGVAPLGFSAEINSEEWPLGSLWVTPAAAIVKMQNCLLPKCKWEERVPYNNNQLVRHRRPLLELISNVWTIFQCHTIQNFLKLFFQKENIGFY